LAWSHHGRCRNEAAFARLAGAAPLPATSGQTQDRRRVNYGGDRRVNSALYMVAVTRLGRDPATRAYTPRRGQDQTRSRPLPQALHRTPRLATPRIRPTPRSRHLTNIEASPARQQSCRSRVPVCVSGGERYRKRDEKPCGPSTACSTLATTRSVMMESSEAGRTAVAASSAVDGILGDRAHAALADEECGEHTEY
jgi:hypothetical protein